MFETRAQKLELTGGRSPKAMLARSKRSLASIRRQIETLALPYAEIDNGVEIELQDLLAKFDAFEQRLKDTADWLTEEADY